MKAGFGEHRSDCEVPCGPRQVVGALVVPADTHEAQARSQRCQDAVCDAPRELTLRAEGPVVEPAPVAQADPAGVVGQARNEHQDRRSTSTSTRTRTDTSTSRSGICGPGQGLGRGQGAVRLPDAPGAAGKIVEGAGDVPELQGLALPRGGEEDRGLRVEERCERGIEARLARQRRIAHDSGGPHRADELGDMLRIEGGSTSGIRARRVDPGGAPRSDRRSQSGFCRSA